MDAAALAALTTGLLALSAGLGLLLGAVIAHSRFCTMGAMSDWVLMGDTQRFRQWLLALLTATLGTGTLATLGLIDPTQSIYQIGPWPWLSITLGGLLMGVGMVLASGCPTQMLVRLGSGNLKALLVLLVLAVTALASLRGLPAVWRVQGLDTVQWASAPPALLGSWLSQDAGLSAPLGQALASVLLILALGLVIVWLQRRARLAGEMPGLRWIWGGMAVGGLLVGMWVISGVWGFVPEHPETLEATFLATASRRMEGLSFVAPTAYWLDAWLYFSDGTKRLTLGMALAAAVPLGAALVAWRQGLWRLQGFADSADVLRHLAGGVLMGFGGVLAMGCTFGQGLSGASLVSLPSLWAGLMMFLGAAATVQIQWWWLSRQEA